MKLERIDRASLAQYLPIRHAERHLVAMALILLVGISTVAWIVSTAPPTNGGALTNASLCGIPILALEMLLAAAMLWKVPESEGSLFKWARHFADRNVYGFRLWCCIDGSGTVSYQLMPMRDKESGFGETHWLSPEKDVVAIGLAANGFEPCILCIRGNRQFGYTKMLNRGIFPESGSAYVQVDDEDGNTLIFETRDLLRFLLAVPEFHENGSHGPLMLSVLRVKSIKERLLDAYHVADKASKELLTERLERDKAVGDIEETVAEIDATKRFVRSKEGAAVRARLAGKLALHLEFRDIPRRKRENAA